MYLNSFMAPSPNMIFILAAIIAAGGILLALLRNLRQRESLKRNEKT
jgi:hypothetical protein